MAKMAKNCWRLLTKKCSTPKTPIFYIKDKQNLYIQNVGHIWGYVLLTPRTFLKSFNGSHKTKRVKKCGKKFQKIIFGGTSKNQRLDPKVCADPSWLLVFKNSL